MLAGGAVGDLMGQAQDAAARDPSTLERVSSSPIAWGVAIALALAAGYFLIRLIEWDQMNRETPNQDDPFAR